MDVESRIDTRREEARFGFATVWEENESKRLFCT